MKYHPLQEVAKLAAGLAAADFFWLVWFAQSHLRSAQFFGMTMTQDMVLPALIFEVAVFIILVHYGWNIGRMPAMRERTYMLIAGVVFTVVAVAHLWRIFAQADVNLAGWMVPIWLSYIGIAVSAFLAYTSFHFASHMGGKRR